MTLEPDGMPLGDAPADPASAEALAERAWDLRNQDPSRALELAERGLAAATEDGDDLLTGRCRLALGYAKMRTGAMLEARRDVEAALEALRCHDDRTWLLAAINTRGILDGIGGDFTAALAAFLEAERLAQELDDARGLADAVNNIAIVYVNLGDHASALEYHLRSLEGFRRAGLRDGVARVLINIGVVYHELGRDEEALAHLREALDFEEVRSEDATCALTLINIAHALVGAGRPDEALAPLQEAMERAERTDNPLVVSYALDAFGRAYARLGVVPEAERCFRESLVLKDESAERGERLETLLSFGELLLGADRPGEALPLLEAALEDGEAVGDRSKVYRAHRLLADVHERRGDLDRALAHHRRFAAVKDEVFNDASDRKLSALRVTFEVEQAEREREIVRLRNVELARANEELTTLTDSLMREQAQVQRLLSKTEKMAREDGLTGALNRRAFDALLVERSARARRDGESLALVLCDVDDFKAVNDRHSHPVGDEVLRRIARILQEGCRRSDIVARYGGEEFILLLPGADKEAAASVAETLRRLVAEHPWGDVSEGLRVTLSLGVAELGEAEHHEALVRLADDRLYAAKRAGKDRVWKEPVVAHPVASGPARPGPASRRPASPHEAHETAPEPPLPPGLRLGREGETVETLVTEAGSVSLLHEAKGLEVIEGTLDDGERLTLVPPAAAGSASEEVYLLLDGALRGTLPDGELVLRAGDRLAVGALPEEVILEAEGPVRFLFLATRPSFEGIRRELHELRRLAEEVELKDGYTADHCRRIQALAYETGRVLGLSQRRLHLLDYGAYLHDVGKVRIPEEVLNKPGALDEAEWELVKKHPTHGRELLEGTFMAAAGAIVEQHHERADGSGYPRGLRGAQILVEASIVAVADCFDAMTSDRPYRQALPAAKALAEIRRCAGSHYPHEVVRAFEVALARLERRFPDLAEGLSRTA